MSNESQGGNLAQRLLQNQSEDKSSKDPVSTSAPTDPLALHQPKDGEVLYECLNVGQPVNSALANGNPISLPMFTSDKGVIAQLDALAEHTGLIKITRG